MCDLDNVTDSQQCEYVQINEECLPDIGLINYLKVILCFSDSETAAILTLVLWLLVLFFTLAITAKYFFVCSLTAICHILGLGEELAGVTFLAFGNAISGFFTQLSTVALGSVSSVHLGLATFYGANLFCTTVIAGSVILTAKEAFAVDKEAFLRDVIFLTLVEGWLLFILWRETTTTAEMALFSCFYIFYVLMVLYGKKIVLYFYKKRKKDGIENSEEIENPLSNNPSSSDAAGREDSTEMASLVGGTDKSIVDESHIEKDYQSIDQKTPANGIRVNGVSRIESDQSESSKESHRSCSTFWELFIRGLRLPTETRWEDKGFINKSSYIFRLFFFAVIALTTPRVDHNEVLNNWNRVLNSLNIALGPVVVLFLTGTAFVSIDKNFNLAELVLIVSLILAGVVFFTTSDKKAPKYHPVFAFLAFAIAIIWLFFVVNEIVNIVEAFGNILGLSQEILGLTVLAWGITLPELIADISLSRKGRQKTALAACYGTPIFDALVSIGFSLLIGTILNGGTYLIPWTQITFVTAMGLIIGLVFSFFWVTISRFKVRNLFAFCLIALYVVLMTLALLFEFDKL